MRVKTGRYDLVSELCRVVEHAHLITRQNFGSLFREAIRAPVDKPRIDDFFWPEDVEDYSSVTCKIYREFVTFLNQDLDANIGMFVGNYWVGAGVDRLVVEQPDVCLGGTVKSLDEIEEAEHADLQRLKNVFGERGRGGVFRNCQTCQAHIFPRSRRAFQSFSELLFRFAKPKKQIVVCESNKVIIERDDRLVVSFPEMQGFRQALEARKLELDRQGSVEELTKLRELLRDALGETVAKQLLEKLGKAGTELGVKDDELSPEGLLGNLLLLLYADRAWKYLWFIPARLPDDMASGGLVVFFKDLPFSRKGIGPSLWPKLISLIQTVVNGVVAYPTAINVNEERHRHAIRAAIATILSRNVSHNLGSHVIPRATVVRVRHRLESFYSSEGLTNFEKQEIVADLKDRIDEYIQKRADFLAEITTKSAYTFRSAGWFESVMLNFVSNTVLIDTLGQNERLGYLSRDDGSLQIKAYEYQDGEPREVRLGYITEGSRRREVHCNLVPYGLRMGRPQDLMDDLPKVSPFYQFGGRDDLAVSLPGPLGEFAIYGILENLIRNAAKHSMGRRDARGKALKKNRRLIINVAIKDASTDCYEVLLWDNVTDPRREVFSVIGGKSAHRKLVDHVNAWFGESLISADGEVRKEAWGLAEILFCASIIAGRDAYEYSDQPIRADAEPDPAWRDGGHVPLRLVYKLEIPKARQAALVGAAFEPLAGRRDLEAAGVSIFADLARFASTGGHGARKRRTAFQFAVLDCNGASAADPIRGHRHLLPFRVLRMGGGRTGIDAATGDVLVPDDFISDKASAGPAAIMEALWRRWLTKWNADTDHPASLFLYLDQKSSEEPLARWRENERRYETRDSCIRVRAIGNDCQAEFTSSGGPKVLYDRHGRLSPELVGQLEEDDGYILFDKTNPDFNSIHSPAFQPLANPWTFPYELIESGLLRVLVLDERMAERALKPMGGSLDAKISYRLVGTDARIPCYWHLAERANVVIATHLRVGGEPEELLGAYPDPGEFPSNKTAVATSPRFLVDVGETGVFFAEDRLGGVREIRKPRRRFDIVVIHQGILDGLPQPTGSEKFLAQVRARIPWVVIESGRGLPPSVQGKNEKFLPFSVLDHTISGIRVAKLSLCRTMLELTRQTLR